MSKEYDAGTNFKQPSACILKVKMEVMDHVPPDGRFRITTS